MAALIRIRRDTSNNWASNDPQLAQGELGLDTDTGVIKVGNGSNVWSDLYSIGVYNSNDRISKTVDTDTGSLIVDEFGKLYFDRGGTITFDDTGNLFAGTGNSNFKITLDNHEGDVTGYNFGHDGILTLPGDSTINTSSDGSTNITAGPSPTATAGLSSNDSNSWLWVDAAGAHVSTQDTAYNVWTFEPSGQLTLPDGGQIGNFMGFTTMSNPNGVAVVSDINNGVLISNEAIAIVANSNPMILNANGILNIPGNLQLSDTSIIHGAQSYTGQDFYIEAIDFSVTDHTVIMITSHGFIDGDKIYINNIGPGSTEELDDTYCYVMVIDPDNFEIYSDKALTAAIWADNYTTFVYSGQQPLNGTVARIYDAGSVNISTTMPASNHDAGSINLNVSDNIWNFGPDGTVTFPTGGRITSSGKGGTSLDGGLDGGWTSLTNYYANANYAACVTAYSNGKLYITTYNDGGPNPSREWEFNNEGNLVLPANGYILNSDLTIYGGTGGAGGGISIGDFGEGFSLTASNKVVTNKLYSTNLTEPTQHYRLEVDTNGVVVLPDQSIINGSTLRGVYGTGEANYTGITIGPDADHREESWVWVDHTGVSIATEYSTSAHTWKFDNDGKLTTPSCWRVGNDTSNTSNTANTTNTNINNTEQIKQIQFELNLLKYLSQSKITKEYINPCLESKIIDNNVFTIFPVFDGYSLNHLTTYLQKLNHDAYYKIIFHLIKTILHGMAKIHQSKIAHQNINNNSILVSTYSNPKQINVKFTDFGLGCGNGNTFINSCKKNNYTPINISEDVIDKLSNSDYLDITQKYDLFCLGIIFIKLLLFFESFSGIDNMDQMNQMNGKNTNEHKFTNNKNFPGFTTNFNQQILDLINNKYLSKLKSKKDLKNIFMFLNINTEAKRDLLEYLKMLLKYVFCKTSDRKTCQYILDKIIIYEKYKNDVF